MATIGRSIQNLLDEARRGHVATEADLEQLPAPMRPAVTAAIARIVALVASGQRNVAKSELDRSLDGLRELADREGVSFTAPTVRAAADDLAAIADPRELATKIPRR